MTQSESKSVALSDALAVIHECSNAPKYKMPVLTIMTPFRPGEQGTGDRPPMSVKLEPEEVKRLYKFLDEYYYEE